MKQNEVHHGVILQDGLMGTALQKVLQHLIAVSLMKLLHKIYT